VVAQCAMYCNICIVQYRCAKVVQIGRLHEEYFFKDHKGYNVEKRLCLMGQSHLISDTFDSFHRIVQTPIVTYTFLAFLNRVFFV
jgi:hypothetical protein